MKSKFDKIKKSSLAMKLLKSSYFYPKYELNIWNNIFFISDILDNHNREYCILYSEINWLIYPIPYYKSKSDGWWRMCPWSNWMTYFKGIWIHYTQETKPSVEIQQFLEKNNKIFISPYTDPIIDYFITNELIQLYIWEISEYYDYNKIFTNAKSQKPWYCFNRENFNIKQFLKDLEIKNENKPDFSNILYTYETNHTILGETKIEVFECSNWLEWHFAKDMNNNIWIDRIQVENPEINKFWTNKIIIDSGWFTNKPVEYNLQLKEVLNDERIIGIDGRYSNICKLINEVWILKDYSKNYE